MHKVTSLCRWGLVPLLERLQRLWYQPKNRSAASQNLSQRLQVVSAWRERSTWREREDHHKNDLQVHSHLRWSVLIRQVTGLFGWRKKRDPKSLTVQALWKCSAQNAVPPCVVIVRGSFLNFHKPWSPFVCHLCFLAAYEGHWHACQCNDPFFNIVLYM